MIVLEQLEAGEEVEASWNLVDVFPVTRPRMGMFEINEKIVSQN